MRVQFDPPRCWCCQLGACGWDLVSDCALSGGTCYDTEEHCAEHCNTTTTAAPTSTTTAGPPTTTTGGGCWLTTATLRARGLGDDCFELRTLRRFRDHYVKQLPRGPAELNHYYQLAPHIVQTIDLRPDRQTIYEEIYTDLIEPAVQLIARGANAPAYALYRSYTLRLARRLNLDPRA